MFSEWVGLSLQVLLPFSDILCYCFCDFVTAIAEFLFTHHQITWFAARICNHWPLFPLPDGPSHVIPTTVTRRSRHCHGTVPLEALTETWTWTLHRETDVPAETVGYVQRSIPATCPAKFENCEMLFRQVICKYFLPFINLLLLIAICCGWWFTWLDFCIYRAVHDNHSKQI
jgi:hypothetical protein